jgi:hypothetical protein
MGLKWSMGIGRKSQEESAFNFRNNTYRVNSNKFISVIETNFNMYISLYCYNVFKCDYNCLDLLTL